jgi:hypothetical protein
LLNSIPKLKLKQIFDSNNQKYSNMNPVLRVAQLDTDNLEEALLLNLKQSINQEIFKYSRLNTIQKYSLEIYAALKFIIWYHTYNKNSQTIGQSLLDWSYFTKNQKNREILTKKFAHALIYCLDEWFFEKLPTLIKRLLKFLNESLNKKTNSNLVNNGNEIISIDDDDNRYKKIDIIFNYIRLVYKAASFLNYIAFLSDGKYLFLWERLLDLKPVYKKPQLMRTLNTTASAREDLWLMYFVLFKTINNLTNLKKLYGRVKNKLSAKFSTKACSTEIQINMNECP